MVTEAQMYWLTRLDSVKSLATPAGLILFFSIIGLLVMIGLSIAAAIVLNTDTEKAQRDGAEMRAVSRGMRWPAGTCFVISLLLCVGNLFVPTSKEYAAIKVIPAILNSTILHDRVKEDFGDFYSLAMEWAKEGLRGATGNAREVVKKTVEKIVEPE